MPCRWHLDDLPTRDTCYEYSYTEHRSFWRAGRGDRAHMPGLVASVLFVSTPSMKPAAQHRHRTVIAAYSYERICLQRHL